MLLAWGTTNVISERRTYGEERIERSGERGGREEIACDWILNLCLLHTREFVVYMYTCTIIMQIHNFKL